MGFELYLVGFGAAIGNALGAEKRGGLGLGGWQAVCEGELRGPGGGADAGAKRGTKRRTCMLCGQRSPIRSDERMWSRRGLPVIGFMNCPVAGVFGKS